jgi:hypothetical protein
MAWRATPAAVAALLAHALAPASASPAAAALDALLAEVLESLTRDAARTHPKLPAELDAATAMLAHVAGRLVELDHHPNSQTRVSSAPSTAAAPMLLAPTYPAPNNAPVRHSRGFNERRNRHAARLKTDHGVRPRRRVIHTRQPSHVPSDEQNSKGDSAGKRQGTTRGQTGQEVNSLAPPTSSTLIKPDLPQVRTPGSNWGASGHSHSEQPKALVIHPQTESDSLHTPTVVADAELLASACIGAGADTSRPEERIQYPTERPVTIPAKLSAPTTGTTTAGMINVVIGSPMAPDNAFVRKKRYRRPVPSAHCHICCRPSRSVPVVVCSNITDGTCRKVICSLCITEYNLAVWEVVSDPSSFWLCTHCADGCANVSRAQCFVYSKTNLKRKLTGAKKKVKTLSPGASDVTGGGVDGEASTRPWVASKQESFGENADLLKLTYSPSTPDDSPRPGCTGLVDSPMKSKS